MKEGLRTIMERWQKAMPRFFRRLAVGCGLVSGTALAVNGALAASGAVVPEWWTEAYPYLVGIPAGMAFVCKFTVEGGYKDE